MNYKSLIPVAVAATVLPTLVLAQDAEATPTMADIGFIFNTFIIF